MFILSTIILYYIILFLLGTVFGSFSTVLIERWKSGKSWIMMGRSECPKCHHILSVRELFPLFSYLFQWGKCRNCRSHIDFFYPIAELTLGILFSIMWYVSITLWNEPISIQTLIFLMLWFITWVYILNDIRYMEIPDQIMIPWIVGYSILIILGYYFPYFRDFLFDYGTYHDYWSFILDHLYATLLIYSFFFLQILIPGGIYLLRNGRSRDCIELLLSYFLFPIDLIFWWMWRKKETNNDESIPAWIGWGDLRVALFIGLTLGSIHTLSALFFAYILGSVIGISLMISSRKQWSQIAFWPFLWAGWVLSIYFYFEIFELFT